MSDDERCERKSASHQESIRDLTDVDPVRFDNCEKLFKLKHDFLLRAIFTKKQEERNSRYLGAIGHVTHIKLARSYQ
jgi:hypothetical protein